MIDGRYNINMALISLIDVYEPVLITDVYV